MLWWTLLQLMSTNDERRMEAAKKLGALGNPRAVEPLIAALGDPNVRVRKCAAEALGKIGDARATEPLIRVLEDWDTRHAAAKALCKLWQSDLSRLIAALEHPHWEVQKEAAELLGESSDVRAIEPLITKLKDYRDVQESAAGALYKPVVLG